MSVCRICSAAASERLFTKDLFDIVRCRKCGLIYTAADPDDRTLRDLYGESYFRSHGAGTSYADYLREESAMAASAARRLAAIRRLKAPPGSLLDVGCATGFFLEAARREWDVAGVELSEYASSYARTQFGLDVRTGTLAGADFPERSFDVVTMWDVVEHLAAPLDDLRQAWHVLKDDGMIVLSTGNADSLFARACGKFWHLYNPDQHLSFFTPRTIQDLLGRAGFKVARIAHPGNFYTLSYLTSSLAMYYPLGVFKSLHWALERTPLKNLTLPVNLRDIMTVYAVKQP